MSLLNRSVLWVGQAVGRISVAHNSTNVASLQVLLPFGCCCRSGAAACRVLLPVGCCCLAGAAAWRVLLPVGCCCRSGAAACWELLPGGCCCPKIRGGPWADGSCWECEGGAQPAGSTTFTPTGDWWGQIARQGRRGGLTLLGSRQQQGSLAATGMAGL